MMIRPSINSLALALVASLVAAAAGCGDRPLFDNTEIEGQRSFALGPAGSTIDGFALLATGRITLDDRTTVLGGDVGASGVGVALTMPAVLVGSEARVDASRVVIGKRLTVRDRGVVGAVRADQVLAPFATVGPVSPFSPPPVVPPVGSVLAGGTSLNVPAGQTVSLSATSRGAVTVHGTLELTGGLYQFSSLTLDNDARVVARARSTVRIAGGLRAADRAHLEVAATLTAGDLRFTVAGLVSGTRSGVLLGNDGVLKALVLATNDVTSGDRLIASGAIAARNVALGHDVRFTLQSGFGCNLNTTCADSSTCTSDACTDGQCANVALPDGTACSDGNACTQPDSCKAGACLGTDLTCTTPATCDAIGICALKAVVSCVIREDDGTFVALFGYTNGADVAIPAAIGPSNQFSPGSADRGQPTSFVKGGLGFWVPVPFDGSPLTWTLGGTQATASKDSPPCPPFPTGGEDDTEGSGDILKAVPFARADTPDPAQKPKVTSDNLFPLVTVPVVDHAEPLAMSAPTDDSGDTLALVDVGLIAQATTRYTEVVLVNSTSETLSFVQGEFEGAAVLQPPSGIAGLSYGHWQSKNGKALQGTGGHMTYSFAGGTQVTVHWDNPGSFSLEPSNSYDSSLSGGGAAGFAVDRVGGGGNQATAFFILRRTTDPSTNCPFGTHQWAVDSLRGAEEPLTGFETATGFITTPLKNITGVGKWEGTGCFAPRVVGRVVATAHSTDRFFTIDVVLDEFDGAFLTGSGKAVRIEVAPAGTLGLMTNPAHAAIVNDGLPALGSRIVFSGRLLIDHGSFLEVHPSEPIQAAKPCNQFGPAEALPLYCNTTLNDFFTWDSGQPPTPMGRADGRVCFLTGMTGQFQDPVDEVHAMIDPATDNWFLTGKAFSFSGQILGIPITITHDLHAEARCLTVKTVSDEQTWNQGDAPVTIGTQDDACFLTRVAGHFEGGGEAVRIGEEVSNGGAIGHTTLGGMSLQAGVSASARCAVKSSLLELGGFAWNQGEAAVGMEFLDVAPGCFLLAVGGAFEGRGEAVQIRADTLNGRVFWELGGMSQQQGVFAFAQCMKP